MKKLFIFLSIVAISLGTMAQGNSQGKGKGKNKSYKSQGNKNKGEDRRDDDDDDDDDNNNKTKNKYSKNQPKKVQAALVRDYPGATNVVWRKYKGDYTATFNNGAWRSTSVYHANGERRDTRTVLTRTQLPGTVWDRIFKRDNIAPKQYIQIERPTTAEKIFRILTTNNTAYFYDQNGNKITYDY